MIHHFEYIHTMLSKKHDTIICATHQLFKIYKNGLNFKTSAVCICICLPIFLYVYFMTITVFVPATLRICVLFFKFFEFRFHRFLKSDSINDGDKLLFELHFILKDLEVNHQIHQENFLGESLP